MQPSQIINHSLETAELPPLRSLEPVGGGCINQCFHCQLTDGQSLFAKLCADMPANFFTAEATGLRALAAATTLCVPRVIHVSESCLLLDYLPEGSPGQDYWTRLAAGLTELHHDDQQSFGFSTDNFCGATPQNNGQWQDGYQFFAEQRLGFQVKLAQNRGLLPDRDADHVHRLSQRLPELIPDETPRLLHGDLWSGNIHTNQSGQPVLIDPACYWGWREADIAMTQLFGRLPQHFYDCYQEALPLEPGWQERMDIYNLYHLLNHLNLFGNSYLPAIRAVLRRFVG